MTIPPRNSILSFAAAFMAAFAFLAVPQTARSDDGAGLMAAAPRPIGAPAIELSRLDGSGFSLAARKGEFTLINFWALWCAPCREEMPALTRLGEKFAGRGLAVVAVNLGDKPDKIARFLRQVGAGELPSGLTVVLDTDGQTGRDWHVQGLPVTYLIDPDGKITHAAVGARDWSGETAVDWFEKILSDTSR